VLGIPLYDPNQSTPLSVASAMDFKNAVSTPVWQRFSTNFRGQRTARHLLVRATELTVPTEAPLYDSGSFVLAQDNIPVAGTCGKLFVTYDVELFIPTKLDGVTGGYAMFASKTAGSHTNNLFAGMDFSQTPDGAPTYWVPDVYDGSLNAHETNYIKLGNSVISPTYLVNNQTQYNAPGYYLFRIYFNCDDIVNAQVSSLSFSGGIVTDFSCKNGGAAIGDKKVWGYTFQNNVKGGAVTINVSANEAISDVRVDITTIPNQTFASVGEMFSSSLTPVITNQSNYYDHKHRYPRTRYFDQANVVVLPDDEYLKFLETGDYRKPVVPRVMEGMHAEMKVMYDRMLLLGLLDQKGVLEHPSPAFDRKRSVEKPHVESDEDDFHVAREEEQKPLVRAPLVPVPITPLIISGGVVPGTSVPPKTASRK